MSTDLIRFALANFTDWEKFESLATELMRNVAYADIKPLGSQSDGGKDAVVERYFSHSGKKIRTIFQFTLRKDVLTKIEETIERLTKSNVEFEKLVIVTRASLSAEKQESVKRFIRSKYELEVEIFEHKALITYLSDINNGVFYRIFPNIRTQMETLFSSEDERRRAGAIMHEPEFLKICYAFTFNPAVRGTKKSLIDQAILGLISLEQGSPISARQVLARANAIFGPGIVANEDQVSAAIARLLRAGWLESNEGSYSLSADGKVFIAGTNAEIEADHEAAIGDIISEIIQASGASFSDLEYWWLEENVRNVLVEYFRLNGLELANSILSGQVPLLVYGQAADRLKELASYRLPVPLGTILFDAIGSALSSPTDEQAKYFAGCSRAYLAAQVMNIDPALREFQSTRIAKKIFILDTDFVLDSIIQELPKSSINRKLVNQLISLGAKVLIPKEVIHEVATHFDISIRTFDYFNDYLNQLTEELVTEEVRNALVKGYWYYARGRGYNRDGFLKYRKNYYDDETMEGFVTEVTKEALPSVNIDALATELGVDVDPARHADLKSVMIELSQAFGKGQNRTVEQIAELADTDALLMQAVAQYNVTPGAVSKSLFRNNAYIITSSGRYIRAAQRLSLHFHVSTRPHILAGLMEMFSPNDMDDRQFVALFENPIIQQSSQRCWGDIKVLLDAGIELRGVSMTRLKHDVETVLHERISAIKEITEDEDAKVDKQIELVEAAEKKGYKPNAVVATLMAKGASVEDELKKLFEENEILRDAVKSFGRRKERWLKRLERTRKK